MDARTQLISLAPLWEGIGLIAGAAVTSLLAAIVCCRDRGIPQLGDQAPFVVG
ncbi:hypothetical protein SAMN04489729_0478 [Amycolatopsis lurida]|uniref:hypothetical protein n=1 Tax=Amycolatopsis lurida TaxID=31959 RepID=UPI00089D0AE2|nr:hypothetical protein [Amycolatopsis lurida]SEB33681.1 hypothetical protein SAMN04489729_0478 [Amycolatopsis lurida]